MDPRRPSNRRLTDAVARLRQLRHDRRLRPALAAALILLTLWALRSDHAGTRAVRAGWEASTDTWQADRPLDAGQVLGPADVRRVALPPIALPLDAVIDNPVGRRVSVAIAPGEILRAERLAGPGDSANASLVGPGRGALTLAADAPHLDQGDRVDLYALLDGSVLATDAEVIAIADTAPVVAIGDSDLPAVIQALSFGDVVPVLVG